LPAARIPQQTPSALGGDYLTKGNMVGGRATAEGREWLEKAVAVLLRGREIALAAGRARDELQVATGKPLVERDEFRDIYLNLGAAYESLGRNRDAIEAYRYGRGIEPFDGRFYDPLARAYTNAGDPAGVALILDEKALLDGQSTATLAAIRRVYAQWDGGACAARASGAGLALDANCAQLRVDMCRAGDDLAQAFTEARRPDKAAEFQRQASGQFGCAETGR